MVAGLAHSDGVANTAGGDRLLQCVLRAVPLAEVPKLSVKFLTTRHAGKRKVTLELRVGAGEHF